MVVVVVEVVVVASQRGKGRSETERKGPVDSSARTGGHLGGVSESERERRSPLPSRLLTLLSSLFLSPGFACLFFSRTLTHARVHIHVYTHTYTHTHKRTHASFSLSLSLETRSNVFTRARSVRSHSLRVCHGRTVVAAAVVPDLYADPTR